MLDVVCCMLYARCCMLYARCCIKKLYAGCCMLDAVCYMLLGEQEDQEIITFGEMLHNQS